MLVLSFSYVTSCKIHKFLHVYVQRMQELPRTFLHLRLVSFTSLSAKLSLTSISKTGSLLQVKKTASILLANLDLRDAQKEHLQWYVATTPDVHPVLLRRHSLPVCFASLQDHLIADLMLDYTLLYTSKVVQPSTHTIDKFSPLIIYLDFEATMTTLKLIKNVATVKVVLSRIGLASDHLEKQ